MSGRKGDDKVASTSLSNKEENLPVIFLRESRREVILHRESRREDSKEENLAAKVISHRQRRRELLAMTPEHNKSTEFDARHVHPFFRLSEDLLQANKDRSGSMMNFKASSMMEQDSLFEAPRKTEVAEGPLLLQPQKNFWRSMNFKAPSRMEEDSLFEAPRKKEVAKGPFFVSWNGELWNSDVPVSLESEVPRPRTRRMEVKKEEHAEEHETPKLKVIVPDDEAIWMTVSQFRDYWNQRWSGHYYGSFEDTTKVPSMRFAYKPLVDEAAVQNNTLQIFSVKLAATRGALQLPLDVFGMVAIRDPVDRNRNIIFQRKRDDCQALTEEDPYLVLAGPTRAVMLEMSPTIIEVDLQVKGATESEDEQLSLLVAPLRRFTTIFSHLFNCAYTSKLSTLEFTLGHIAFSVEATIFVHVVHGSWPDCYRGLFTAFTTGFTDRCPMPIGDELSTGTGDEGILLLDSRGERLPVAGDGRIQLSRRVVSVEGCGKLTVKVNALEGETKIVGTTSSFHASKSGKSVNDIDVTFCKMEVTVVWSLISCYPLGAAESFEGDPSVV